MGNLRQKYTDEEWDQKKEGVKRKLTDAGEHITSPTKDVSDELMEAAINKGFMGSEVGAKYSDDKAPMGTMLRQFPLALQGVAQRSLYGHNKYKEFDHDWMNFKRAPDAINQYLNASVRHLAEIGDDEDYLEHLKAAAWNILATLQITLENEE